MSFDGVNKLVGAILLAQVFVKCCAVKVAAPDDVPSEKCAA